MISHHCLSGIPAAAVPSGVHVYPAFICASSEESDSVGKKGGYGLRYGSHHFCYAISAAAFQNLDCCTLPALSIVSEAAVCMHCGSPATFIYSRKPKSLEKGCCMNGKLQPGTAIDFQQCVQVDQEATGCPAFPLSMHTGPGLHNKIAYLSIPATRKQA